MIVLQLNFTSGRVPVLIVLVLYLVLVAYSVAEIHYTGSI